MVGGVTSTPLLTTDGSEPMGAVLRDLARVAPSRLPILILGPTGCGKELAARELHRLSGREGPLVPVNCAAFSESLMESEVFGHVRGAFTGALRDRTGAIEAAEGGTLFLDEVADLSPRLQSLFLRVLQEREVRRVGGEGARRVDVRFVAATHRPLEALAAAGAFRWDLLFRLRCSGCRGWGTGATSSATWCPGCWRPWPGRPGGARRTWNPGCRRPWPGWPGPAT